MAILPVDGVSPAIVGDLLEELTPVDRSVGRVLPEEVERFHVLDLVKRLHLAAEVGAPGRGSKLLGTALGRDDVDAALRDVDAVLEFGLAWDDLDDAQREQAGRAEIRQEIQHFDRIMDLESLAEGRRALKTRRDFVNSDGLLGAAERLLVLVHERRTLRGDRPAQWLDLSEEPQRHVGGSGEWSVLERDGTPHVRAVAWGGSESSREQTLLRLETYALRHPLAVALALVDYERFVAAHEPVHLVAAALCATSGGIVAEIWAGGLGSWAVIGRDGYRQRVVGTGRLDAEPAGGPRSSYQHERVHLPDSSWIVLTAGRDTLAATDLAGALNRRNGAGRINARDNLDHLLGRRTYALAKAQHITTPDAPAIDEEQGYIDAVTRQLVDGVTGLRLAIECGHVHADRELGPAQLRGLHLGVRFMRSLAEQARARGVALDGDVTPMVDDDHVLNRLMYRRYAQLFAEQGLPVDDLILESSPLVRAVAHDVLRRAIQLEGRGFRLEELGRNLYLVGDGLRLELVEDLRGAMRNGCVMFEVGLVIYRAARRRIVDTFWEETGLDPFPLHQQMADVYDREQDPVARERARQEFEALFVDPWDSVAASPRRTPFLDAYTSVLAEAHGRRHRVVVFNVLEDYYRPQQEKVRRLAQLLDIPLPLEALFFSPHGLGFSSLGTTGSLALAVSS